MDFVFYLLIFLFGLIAGSFLNVVICRLETGQTVVSGRSHCPHCGQVLAWHDLIPVLSFLILGGKCRYCGKRISWQYPLVELATGILFVIIFNFSVQVQGGSASGGKFLAFNLYFLLSTFYLLFIASSFIVIFVYDLRHYIIPNEIVYPVIAISLFYRLIEQTMEVGLPYYGSPTSIVPINFLSTAFITSAFFLSIVLITRGNGMGGGDVKFAFLMGLVLGWPKVLAALFLAFTAGAIYGIILMVVRKKTLKSQVPFGPFLAAGTITTIFWGEEIVKWYGGYLL